MPDLDLTADSAADLDLIREAAIEGGRIAMRYFGKSPEVWMKAGASPVSEADFAVNTFLHETLIAARPDYGWLSEESADGPERLSSRRLFVVDPIDGTRGFINGLDLWCVSVAVVEAGKPLTGVLECPARRETLTAQAGGGAYRNGARIAVRAAGERLDIASAKTFIDAMPSELQRRTTRAPHIPSLAYRLAKVAAGEIDATFVKPDAHQWDIAAADLILREAGGELLDEYGRRPVYGGADVRHGAMVAGSGPLLARLATVIRS